MACKLLLAIIPHNVERTPMQSALEHVSGNEISGLLVGKLLTEPLGAARAVPLEASALWGSLQGCCGSDRATT